MSEAQDRSIHEAYMREALALARRGAGTARPNPMVGAVLVREGEILGRGWHVKRGEAHAEVHAIENARSLGRDNLAGSTLYVTLEPCSHHGRTPPCAEQIIAERISHVVCAMTDPNPLVSGKGFSLLRAAGIRVTEGILEEEARSLNRAFITYITTGKPHVTLKTAMSLDGKTATATGHSKWITGIESRKRVHRQRMESAAILCGIGTVLADDPELTCRLEPEATYPGEPVTDVETPRPWPQPLRVVADTQLRIPLESRLVRTAREVPLLIVAGESWLSRCGDILEPKRRALEEAGAVVLALGEKDGRVCLRSLIAELGKREIDSLLIEAGATLAEGALEAGIVNRIHYYLAPILIGGTEAPGAIGGRGIQSLTDAWKITNMSISQAGKDICIEGDLCSRES